MICAVIRRAFFYELMFWQTSQSRWPWRLRLRAASSLSPEEHRLADRPPYCDQLDIRMSLRNFALED